MLSGPAAFRGLILDRVFLTSAADRQSAWSLGGIGEGWIIITGLWQGLVVSDGLNGLPQALCVSAVREVINFLSL